MSYSYFHATYNATNQEYLRGDGAVEGGDYNRGLDVSRLFRRSQECSYDRGDEGMAAGFWI